MPTPVAKRLLPAEKRFGPGGQLVAGLVAGDQVRVEVAAAQLEADVGQHDVGREQRHVVDAVADDVDERERLAVVVLRDVDDAELEAAAAPGGVDDAQAEAAGGAGDALTTPSCMPVIVSA